MRKIHFSKEYKKKILKGEKKATIRLGKRKFKVGETVEIIVGDEKIGEARITNVFYTTLDEIGKEEVRRDGFTKKSKLEKALKKHYPKIKRSSTLTVIEFEMIKGGSQTEA